MIDGGIILFLIAAFIAFMMPAERALARRAHHHIETPMPPIAAAYRIPPPAPSLEALAAQAEAAVDADALARGVRDVAAVYQRAARQRH